MYPNKDLLRQKVQRVCKKVPLNCSKGAGLLLTLYHNFTKAKARFRFRKGKGERGEKRVEKKAVQSDPNKKKKPTPPSKKKPTNCWKGVLWGEKQWGV